MNLCSLQFLKGMRVMTLLKFRQDLFFIPRMIHEAHKHTVTVGGHRIHALLQSTFEVSIICLN